MRTCISILITVLWTSLACGGGISISNKEAASIGRKIWKNECGGTVAGLTAWNAGEEFPSLGIGHFIWYPPGREGPFDESFPKLVDFLRREGAQLPAILKEHADAPWRTKVEFDRDLHSTRMQSLREFLARTVPDQTRFIVHRLETALPKMLAAAPSARRHEVRSRFYAVASTPHGVYALIDYVNFKGEGVLETERYKGEGWGLLQVLENMSGAPNGPAAVRDFARSAKEILARRVRNSPPARHESRWLSGWKSRIDTDVE